MNSPLKVTFDKNAYEFVINPNKDAPLTDSQRYAYQQIHNAVLNNTIHPFISETILTYEAVTRKDRQTILTKPDPILIKSNGSRVTISSNPDIFPGNHLKDETYLQGAIQIGFKILPGKRFGKLVNPAISTDWYYYLTEDYLSTSERFTEVVRFIQDLGGRIYSVYQLNHNSRERAPE